MTLEYRVALPEDVPECLDVRGRTRENAISAEGLGDEVLEYLIKEHERRMPGRGTRR